MAFHLSHIHDYDTFLAIDIGSYRVRTGAYIIDAGEVKNIGFWSTRQNKRNMMHGCIADLRWVSLAMERSMIQAIQPLPSPPEDVIVAFSSNTFISDILVTQYVRSDRTTEITMQEVDTMVKKLEKESFGRIRSRSREQFGILHDDIRLVSSTITSISIDGKNVTNPVGFSGSHIRLSVLNVFAPASEFNVIRSIVAHLDKRIISLIPTPLVFPKIIENTDYIDEAAYILDIGAMHTNFLSIQKNQIQILETFPFGANMLIDLIEDAHPGYTLLQIESLLSDTKKIHTIQSEIEAFFEYVYDTMMASVTIAKKDMHPSYIFCHGWVFENIKIFDLFSHIFHEKYKQKIHIHRLSDIVDIPPEQVVNHGLSLLADELLVVKKDPLVRILRYVLYSYE